MNRNRLTTLILAFVLLLSFVTVLLVQTQQRRGRVKTLPHLKEAPHPRIVSLVPSVTETLFMLGLGNHVIARSNYCDYPPIVTNLPALGSLGNVNIEAIARLKPDYVILSDAQAQSKVHTALAKLKINHLGVPASSLNDIYQSVWDLAERFDANPNAEIWLERMNVLNEKVKANAPKNAPRILVCAGRDVNAFDRLYISGKNNFYEGVVKLVGGKNAYSGDLPYPMISLEGVVQMNPDIVIDVVIGGSDEDVFNALFQWGNLATVNAIKTGDVHILTETWAVRPGPRIDMLIKTVADYVAEWEARK